MEIPYTKVEVNPLTKEQIKTHSILKVTNTDQYMKVPIVLFGNMQINDSLKIVKHAQNELSVPPSKKLQCIDPASAARVEKSIEWAYNRYVKLLPANLYRNLPESW